MSRFVEASKEFIQDADWLSSADGPAVTALLALAEELDTNGITAPMVTQYRLTHAALLKSRPKEAIVEQDEWDAFMATL